MTANRWNQSTRKRGGDSSNMVMFLCPRQAKKKHYPMSVVAHTLTQLHLANACHPAMDRAERHRRLRAAVPRLVRRVTDQTATIAVAMAALDACERGTATHSSSSSSPEEEEEVRDGWEAAIHRRRRRSARAASVRWLLLLLLAVLLLLLLAVAVASRRPSRGPG